MQMLTNGCCIGTLGEYIEKYYSSTNHEHHSFQSCSRLLLANRKPARHESTQRPKDNFPRYNSETKTKPELEPRTWGISRNNQKGLKCGQHMYTRALKNAPLRLVSGKSGGHEEKQNKTKTLLTNTSYSHLHVDMREIFHFQLLEHLSCPDKNAQ